MRIAYCEQGSPEWFQCRAGHITSSVIDDVLRKKADAVTRQNLKARIVAEILSGKPCEEGYQSKWMQDGKDKEPFARTAYELRENVMVETVGFVYHPTIERCGTSPDSLVGDDGVLEIKCPRIATHVDYLLRDRVPPEYIKQCIWHLVCTRRKWVDFVSFAPELPDHLQLFIKRMEVDDEVVAMFEKEARQFLDEVNGLRVQYDALDKVTACR
jgi:hypothetical protein